MGVSECRGVGVSECRGVGVSECGSGVGDQSSVISDQLSVIGDQSGPQTTEQPDNEEPRPTNCPPEAPAGACIDMSASGALADALNSLAPEWLLSAGSAARARVENRFSKDVVILEYVDYYRVVMEKT